LNFDFEKWSFTSSATRNFSRTGHQNKKTCKITIKNHKNFQNSVPGRLWVKKALEGDFRLRILAFAINNSVRLGSN